MILVVEGISACGKTTWCATHGAEQVIAEHGRQENEPDLRKNPDAVATFWTQRNVERWQAALAMEQATGLAICDSDPLKLHYIWSLWQIGEAQEADWLRQMTTTRNALAQGSIGFADAYVVARIDPDLARQRAQADATRQRSKFELHARLQPPLLRWYSAIEQVLPGRVQFSLPDTLAPRQAPKERYALKAFDRLIDSLS